MTVGDVALVMMLAVAAPDSPESHVSVGRSSADVTPAQQLAKRLAELRQDDIVRLMQQVQANNVDPSIVAKLRNDPAAQEMIRKMMAGDPDIKSALTGAIKQHPLFKNLSKEDLQELMKAVGQRVNRNGQPKASTDSAPVTPPREPQESVNRRAITERLNDFFHDMKMENVSQSLQDSSTFRDVLRELAKPGGTLPMSSMTAGDLADKFAKLEDMLGKVKEWLPKSMPRIPRLQLSAPKAFENISLGRPSFDAFPNIGDGWSMPLAAVAVVGMAIFGWRITARAKRLSSAAPRFWVIEPIDPDGVTTRDELIRAYEQLAMYLFGPDAAHWHHRQVADRLAAAGAARSDADAVADLYEQARYAPAAPRPSWEVAREPLRRLAARRQ